MMHTFVTEVSLHSWLLRTMVWHPQILADQLTLSQPGGADYAHLIYTGIPGFSDLPTALRQDLHAI